MLEEIVVGVVDMIRFPSSIGPQSDSSKVNFMLKGATYG